MKKPKPKAPPKPRNVAAKALRSGQFQPRVEDHPKAYRRRPKHRPDPPPPGPDEDKDEG
jgi:hypothetical protein